MMCNVPCISYSHKYVILFGGVHSTELLLKSQGAIIAQCS